MSNPTSNFGWQMPTATDLVTDLPADFEVFGQAVDTDLADLNGGTTGQLLSKTSATDLDFTWVDPSTGDITGVTAGTGISGGGTSGTVTVTNSMATAIDAKGDLVAGTGADAFSRLAIGANNTILTADSSEATGMKWALGASGLTKITSGSFSDVASVTVDDVFSATYLNYMLVLNIFAATRTDDLHVQLRYGANTRTTSYYTAAFKYDSGNALATWGEQATAQFVLTNRIGNTSEPSAFTVYFGRVGNTGQQPTLWGTGTMDGPNGAVNFAGWLESTETFTGIVIKSSSSNITGNYRIYGLAN